MTDKNPIQREGTKILSKTNPRGISTPQKRQGKDARNNSVEIIGKNEVAKPGDNPSVEVVSNR